MILRIGLCLVAAIIALGVSPVAGAVSTDVRLEITPPPCTLDILNTGISQQMIVQPAQCREIPQVQEQARQLSPDSEIISEQAAPKVSLIETAILQPLASLFGFGESHGSPVRPITTSMTLVTVTGFVIDAAFFERWTARRIGRIIRGAIKKLRALTAGVLRR